MAEGRPKARDSKRRSFRGELTDLVRVAVWRVATEMGGYDLKPLANVKNLGAGSFRSSSTDPQLSIVPQGNYPSGRVRVELEVSTRPAYPFAPELYWDTGDGWRQENCAKLPLPVAGKISASVVLPPKVRHLRLDVGGERGAFRVLGLRLRSESLEEAGSASIAASGLDTNGAQPISHGSFSGRMALLDLYATENNRTRALAVQHASSRHGRSPGPLQPGVSVIILNLNKPELIVPLLDRLERDRAAFEAQGLRLQVLMGDTGSTDAQVLARYASAGSDTFVQRDLKYQFSRCNNAMARLAECDTLLFLNNDVIFPEDRNPILEMHRVLHGDSKRGVVGCCLYFEDLRVQHLGVDFLREPAVRGLCYHPKAREQIEPTTLAPSWRVPAVTGACLMMRHALFAQAGWMDEGYRAECQDIALCLAADRFGYESHIVNAGRVLHLENATRPKGEENWPDRQRFLRHWGAYIEATFL